MDKVSIVKMWGVVKEWSQLALQLDARRLGRLWKSLGAMLGLYRGCSKTSHLKFHSLICLVGSMGTQVVMQKQHAFGEESWSLPLNGLKRFPEDVTVGMRWTVCLRDPRRLWASLSWRMVSLQTFFLAGNAGCFHCTDTRFVSGW
jgi:hypothetical protein